MHSDLIKHVSQIPFCPHCNAPWTGDTIDMEIFKLGLKSLKTGNQLTFEEAQVKAALYGWSTKDEVRISKVRFLLSDTDKDGDNFYQCPECDTMYHLGSGNELSAHEKSLQLALLQA